MTNHTQEDKEFSARLFVLGGFSLVPSPHAACYGSGSCNTRGSKSPAKLTVVRAHDPLEGCGRTPSI
jgi:hypothetical protein